MKSLFLLPSTLFLLSAFAPLAQAQLLAWNVSGNDGNEDTLPAGLIDSNLLTDSGFNELDRVGLTPASGQNSFNSSGWNLTNTFNEANDYVTFTLQPQAGQEMTLTSLQFTLIGNANAPNTTGWGYRIGGGAFVFQPTFTAPTTSSSLTTWDFDDFTTTQAVEFRLWTWGTGSVGGGTSSSGGAIRINNGVGGSPGYDLLVNGSIAPVPEPGTFGLLGLGLINLALIRRRFVRS